MQILLDPGQQRTHRGVIVRRRRWVVNNELGLSAGAFQRHDHQPSRKGGDLCAQIPPNHVET